MRWLPKTMTQLVAVGGLIAAAPLLLGLALAGFSLDHLAKRTEHLLSQGMTREHYGAQLRDNLADLRRNAQQYAALRDPALLNVFFTRWWAAETTLQQLEALGLQEPVTENVVRLRQGLTASARHWAQALHDEVSLNRALEQVQQLMAEADEIVAGGRASAAAQLDELRGEAAGARQLLLLLALTLIPLTALLAFAASVAVTRPLRDLGRGISALGHSRYDQPIQIDFPSEMQRLGEYLDWLRRKLAQLEADKDLFLRHVSHELKTPLATIKEGTALLREGSLGLLTPRQNEVSQILAEAAVELGARIANLLSYAEWREDRRAANMTWFDARPLVEETLAAQKLLMVRRTLSTELDIQTPRLFGQRAQIRVALDNLVANAIKHSPKGGAISIRAAIADQRCQVWVRDHGRGVRPRDRERIFEPFVRGPLVDAATPGSLPGSGIGLSVVRETVLAHGGTVEVEDARPGAVFKMEWPCGAEDSDRQPLESRGDAGILASRIAAGGERAPAKIAAVRAPLPALLGVVLVGALLSACAQLPMLNLSRSGARQHLEFYTHAVNATPAMREQLWRENATAPAEMSQLRKALLQSIPGSARYNPAEAEAGLRSLLAEDPSAEVAAVARMRLETLHAYTECRAEADVLKKRLAKIADIERATDAPLKTQRP